MRLRTYIRGVFFFAVFCSLLAGITVIYKIDQADNEYRLARKIWNADTENYQYLLTDYRWVGANEEDYLSLAGSSLFGVADEVPWLDFLGSMGNYVLMDDYEFRIGPSSTHALDKDLSMVQVDISLSANLMHDVALERLLNRLLGHAPGTVYIRSMEVARLDVSDRNVVAAGERYSLSIFITLAWLTLMPESISDIAT